jgi:hypothetical protein
MESVQGAEDSGKPVRPAGVDKNTASFIRIFVNSLLVIVVLVPSSGVFTGGWWGFKSP